MKIQTLALLLSLAVGPGMPGLSAGTITGTVTAVGPAGAGGGSGDGAYASLRYKFAERVDYAHLQDFIIYVDEPLPATGPLPLATVTQRDVSFEPRVLAVAVGTTIRWPNADTIYHNVFSLSDAKTFDLGLYARNDPAKELVFDKVGQVDVFCGIHSKMHCIILVLPNSYFAKANANQTYIIRDVPAGTHRLRAWHERLPSRMRTVTVTADGNTRVDFTLRMGGAKD